MLLSPPPSPQTAPHVQTWYLELIRQVHEHEGERPLEDRLATRLGGTLWARCRREWKTVTCRSVEHVARRVEALSQESAEGHPDPVDASRWLRWLGVDFGGRALAGGLVRAVLPPTFPDPQEAAYALRLYGVAVCFVRWGLLGFEHCACAASLAGRRGPAAVAVALARLPDLAPPPEPEFDLSPPPDPGDEIEAEDDEEESEAEDEPESADPPAAEDADARSEDGEPAQ
jgi:hypothetical protein